MELYQRVLVLVLAVSQEPIVNKVHFGILLGRQPSARFHDVWKLPNGNEGSALKYVRLPVLKYAAHGGLEKHSIEIVLVLGSIAVHHSDRYVVVTWPYHVGLGFSTVLIRIEKDILQ